MSFAWDHLTIETTIKRRRRLGDIEFAESESRRLRRVRVVVDGRLGSYTLRDGSDSLDAAVSRAVDSARFGPPAPVGLLAIGPKNPVRVPMDGQGEVAFAAEEVGFVRSAELVDSAGRRLRWESRHRIGIVPIATSRGPVPVTRTDAPAETKPLRILEELEIREPTLQAPRRRWLLSPVAASGLLLEPWLAQLTDPHTEGCWRPELEISDRGHGRFDLEGTPRRPVTFVSHGRRCCRPLSRADALDAGKNPTGHGGLAGVAVEDLSIGQSSVLPQHDQPLHGDVQLICASRTRPQDPGGADELAELTFLSPGLGTVSQVARIQARWWLTQPMRWVGPVQPGRWPWRSPWLLIEEPAAFASIMMSSAPRPRVG